MSFFASFFNTFRAVYLVIFPACHGNSNRQGSIIYFVAVLFYVFS